MCVVIFCHLSLYLSNAYHFKPHYALVLRLLACQSGFDTIKDDLCENCKWIVCYLTRVESRMSKSSKLAVLCVFLAGIVSLVGCQQIRETHYLMEVTVEVTRIVVVTATESDHTPTAPPQEPTPTPVLTETPVVTQTATNTPDSIPEPETADIIVSEQLFERGRMYYVQPRGEMWVLIYDEDSNESGLWAYYNDSWLEGMPESDPAIIAPEGFYQPIRGFGHLWRNNEFVRDVLGWAIDDEYGFWTQYRYEYGGVIDETGEYIPAPGEHQFRGHDGVLIRFNESDGTWVLDHE